MLVYMYIDYMEYKLFSALVHVCFICLIDTHRLIVVNSVDFIYVDDILKL